MYFQKAYQLLYVLPFLLFSCGENAQEPKQNSLVITEVLKDSLPFIAEEKVDTTKMVIYNKPCAIGVFCSIDSVGRLYTGDKEGSINKTLCDSMNRWGLFPQTNKYYYVIDFMGFYSSEIERVLEKEGIPTFKLDTSHSYLCFIDKDQHRYYMDVRSLRNKSGAITFNGREKPSYLEDIPKEVLDFPYQYYQLKKK
ncbi:MAG: hypothetical protein ACKOXB_08105 [Flavobacteriales bacterium]